MVFLFCPKTQVLLLIIFFKFYLQYNLHVVGSIMDSLEISQLR